MPDSHFRADLYSGTAADYDRFRPAYPSVMMRDLLRRAGIDTGGSLLDLACGTGQVAFALRDRFDNVWAVDQEPGAVEFGRAQAERLGALNVRWIARRAENLELSEAGFDLVTIGNAFHRLRRGDIARRACGWLKPGCCIALLWGDAPWEGAAEWQLALSAFVQRWTSRIGSAHRIPAGLDQAIAETPHTTVLSDAGFEVVGRFDFIAPHTWSVESLAGFAFSTSVLSRAVLGAQAQPFADDLRRELIAIRPSGRFEQDISFAYDLARRRTAS